MHNLSNQRFKLIRSGGLICLTWLIGTTVVHAQSLRDTFKRVNPAVVMIHTQEEVTAPTGNGSSTTVPTNLPALELQQQGVGSGVLVSADGKVLTAAHVVGTADQIEVEFLNGERVLARVMAAAPTADIALLQLERVPSNATVATFGDSNELETGDQVFAVGAPYGARHSLAVGWISARRVSETILENLSALETFQIDLSLYQGNSGGPLFNLAGEIVGIVTHVLTRDNQITGPGFAVTANTARKLMLEDKQLWLGIETWLIEGTLAEAFNLPQSAGLLVQAVAANSLGSRLGIREGKLAVQLNDQPMLIGGDVLLEMAGVPVRPTVANALEIRHQLNGLRTGDQLRVKVLRAGQLLNLSVTIP